MSVLIAAGIAVYENPQVRQWVDNSRRKIAVALHSLGDEIGPRPPPRRSPPDPSTRPDESPEAVERRRRARQEILERGRALQEKRARRGKSYDETSQSFDTIVDQNGSLINEKEEANTTAADIKPHHEDQDLRRRNTEAADATTLGSATTRSSTPTLQMSPVIQNIDITSPPVLGIDTETISNHSSEALLDLTPTASNFSADHAEISEPPDLGTNLQDLSRSVHEWASNTTSPFYSATLEEHPNRVGTASDEESQSHGEPADAEVRSLSFVGTSSDEESQSHGESADAEVRSLSFVGTNSDIESEDGQTTGTCTPGSWSEIGSVVSEDF